MTEAEAASSRPDRDLLVIIATRLLSYINLRVSHTLHPLEDISGSIDVLVGHSFELDGSERWQLVQLIGLITRLTTLVLSHASENFFY